MELYYVNLQGVDMHTLLPSPSFPPLFLSKYSVTELSPESQNITSFYGQITIPFGEYAIFFINLFIS